MGTCCSSQEVTIEQFEEEQKQTRALKDKIQAHLHFNGLMLSQLSQGRTIKCENQVTVTCQICQDNQTHQLFRDFDVSYKGTLMFTFYYPSFNNGLQQKKFYRCEVLPPLLKMSEIDFQTMVKGLQGICMKTE